MGCLVDLLIGPITDFLTPKTPWAWFVRLAVIGVVIVAYLVAEDARALPWQ